MFDTCALNRLCDNAADYGFVVKSLDLGFEYYFTDIQVDESKNTINPKNAQISDVVIRERAERALKLVEIIAKTQPKFLFQFATLNPGGWPLNGSRDILPDDESAAWNMYLDIWNNNPNYRNDAMIGLVAIVNGCSIVSADCRFFKKIHAHFPGQVIQHSDFIDMLKKVLS